MANVDDLLPRVGEQIESYQLVAELARGGFSVVFRAIQISLRADVAIKFLAPPSLAQVKSQQLLQRFQQEARVAQQLQHPCAIKVRDYGRTPKGLMYLVTDFIDGRVLTKVVREQPLSVARTVRVASQVLGCLNEAHGLGIVHRDLKPDNIMLRDFSSETDVVTVLDFGVAKVAQSYDGVSTLAGMTLGTAHYTAPEQCRGEREIDGRADLYAVGLILAECLTGRRVVGTDNQMAAVYIHAGAQPLEFEPALHHSPLFPVIQRATQKKKELRFADAKSMREALEMAGGGWQHSEDAIATKPILSQLSPRITSSAQPVRPTETWPTWLGLTVLALVGGALCALIWLIVRGGGQEPVSDGSDQPRAVEAQRPVDPDLAEIHVARDQPAGGGVRASIHAVSDEGSERRVTLMGCGFASGMLVGERAPIGDTGLDLEIMRLRNDTQCIARTLATASQLRSVTEVVFRGF